MIKKTIYQWRFSDFFFYKRYNSLNNLIMKTRLLHVDSDITTLRYLRKWYLNATCICLIKHAQLRPTFILASTPTKSSQMPVSWHSTIHVHVYTLDNRKYTFSTCTLRTHKIVKYSMNTLDTVTCILNKMVNCPQMLVQCTCVYKM